jgi:hypothetical protein
MDFPADPTYPFLISVIYMGGRDKHDAYVKIFWPGRRWRDSDVC